MKKAQIPLNLILILPFLSDLNSTIGGRTTTGVLNFLCLSFN